MNALSIARSSAANTPQFSIFTVDGVTAGFYALTIANGQTSSSGGGIVSYGGAITLDNVAMRGNSARRNGGAVAVLDANLTMNGCKAKGTNVAGYRGGGGALPVHVKQRLTLLFGSVA